MPVNTDLEQQGGPHTRPNAPAEGVRSPGIPPSGHGVGVGHLPSPEPGLPHDLPPGVHPDDASKVTGGFPVTLEKEGEPYKRGRRPFGTPNKEAFPVYQRAASHFRTQMVAVNTNNGGVAYVVGRRAGRRSVTLWIPSQVVAGNALVTPPNGVMVGATEGELQQGGGVFLGVGDSMTIESEQSVAVGLVPGTSLGYVQYLDLFDDPTGGVTGNT
jgi:hypothetical protein